MVVVCYKIEICRKTRHFGQPWSNSKFQGVLIALIYPFHDWCHNYRFHFPPQNLYENNYPFWDLFSKKLAISNIWGHIFFAIFQIIQLMMHDWRLLMKKSNQLPSSINHKTNDTGILKSCSFNYSRNLKNMIFRKYVFKGLDFTYYIFLWSTTTVGSCQRKLHLLLNWTGE